jgi:hypothetical protein
MANPLEIEGPQNDDYKIILKKSTFKYPLPY